MKLLGKPEINHIAVGAAILASGGGGDPYVGEVMALNAIKKYGPITLLSVDELKPDTLIVATGTIGAPTVSFEKVPNGEEAVKACQQIEQYCQQQIDKFKGKKISAIYPIEIGGINSLWPLATAARLGVPVVDVDGMGRAFPEYQMTTLSLDDISASPFVVVDAKLNTEVIQAEDNHSTEKLARARCIKMGSTALLAAYPITPHEAKKSGILGTLSFAQQIGETVTQARDTKVNVIQALTELLQGFVLFHAKISAVEQHTEGGFTRGTVWFTGLGSDSGDTFEISFQNEYLLAKRCRNHLCSSQLLCTTPDLIILLDEESGTPILTERLWYGARVVVLGVPANEKWRTPRGLAVAGPRYFKYDRDFEPVEKLMADYQRCSK